LLTLVLQAAAGALLFMEVRSGGQPDEFDDRSRDVRLEDYRQFLNFLANGGTSDRPPSYTHIPNATPGIMQNNKLTTYKNCIKENQKKKNKYSMLPCCGDLIHPLRAIPRDSLFPFQLLEIEILIEKYPLRVSLSGYPNIAIIYFRFLASQR